MEDDSELLCFSQTCTSKKAYFEYRRIMGSSVEFAGDSEMYRESECRPGIGKKLKVAGLNYSFHMLRT